MITTQFSFPFLVLQVISIVFLTKMAIDWCPIRIYRRRFIRGVFVTLVSLPLLLFVNFENLSIFKLTHNTFPRMNKLNANSDANDLNTRCNLLSSRQRFFNAVQSLWLFQTLFQTWFNWLKVIASMWWYMCHVRFCQVLYRWAYFCTRWAYIQSCGYEDKRQHPTTPK